MQIAGRETGHLLQMPVNRTWQKELYHYIIESCKNQIAVVEQGVFGADMKISLVNDGPLRSFLILMNSYDENRKNG